MYFVAIALVLKYITNLIWIRRAEIETILYFCTFCVCDFIFVNTLSTNLSTCVPCTVSLLLELQDWTETTIRSERRHSRSRRYEQHTKPADHKQTSERKQYTRTYIHTCMYVHTYIHTCMHMYIYVCMHLFMYVAAHVFAVHFSLKLQIAIWLIC